MKRKLLFLFIAALSLLFITSCDKKDNFDGYTKIIFYLEGAEFNNSTAPLVQYYKFKADTVNKIKDPFELNNESDFIYSGYHLEGWYKTKTLNEYSDKWDFDTDTVEANGISLYAKWVKNIKHTYTLGYMDNDEFKVLGVYDANEGEKFNDIKKYYNKYPVKPSTFLDYRDQDGNLWDEDFVHPGGDEDVDIKVIATFIEGTYKVVKTVNDLKSAKNSNIYLYNDLDLNNEKFNFNGYNYTFIGNNHTISNITVNYTASQTGLLPDLDDSNLYSLYISLFGNLNNATIKDVTFTNVNVDVNTTYSKTTNIYVSPLCNGVINSTISNVCVSYNFSYSNLPTSSYQDEHLIYITDRAYVTIDENSTIENISLEGNTSK